MRFLTQLMFAIGALAVAARIATATGALAEVLVHAATATELELFLGVPVVRCVPSGEAMVLCEWQLGNDAAGWAPLAEAINTTDRLSLLCEVSLDGTMSPATSCSAYAMRSNRGRWAPPAATIRAGQGRKRRVSKESRDQTKSAALAELESARTLVELSHLVGITPVDCWPGLPGSQICLWRATAKTPGHGTLAASIAAPLSKKVVMRCSLPLDGQPRNPRSCQVEIGA